MDIAVLLYEGFTTLDCIGPYEVLRNLSGATVTFVAEARGEVRADSTMLGITADRSIDEVGAPEMLLIPGGFGTRRQMNNERLLEWIRSVHAHTKWTTSVCTGALLLGAAGLLDGLNATTHWASKDILETTGAHYREDRIVRNGKIITAAGVSAGIDMGLYLVREIAGDDFAMAVQLGIEYDPQPPFDCGSPSKAPKELVELVAAAMNATEAEASAS